MEPQVTIAIPDLAGSTARAITLAALACHTPEPHAIVLLSEEPGSASSLSPGVEQLLVSKPFSAPAALNRLLETTTTPYILFLESGAIVTPGWLQRLLAPLSDPAVGLSGPSTNMCWNEQQVVAKPGNTRWTRQQIDTYAASIATRYRNQWKSLDTLHSLADFCYLFKRPVAEELGGFDEAYGAGPCWEVDFNTRAARAGYRAAWVADAYVHRAPATAAQIQTINYLLTASKQLYQDRFCGLRLRGEKTGYEFHCRGEACEHFAPRNLIRVTLNPGRAGNSTGEQGQVLAEPSRGIRLVKDTKSVSSPSDDLPLVSCIMPTRNRRTFVRQALAYFERQDYPNCELIIVDDGDDRVSDLVPSDARVRYIALPRQTSIGAKRNIACEQARGAIIAHWDDDDWYAPHRLRHQVAPLLDGRADITGLETSCFFDLAQWRAWTCTPDLHRRLFVGDVHGGTLVYYRRVWERMAHYPAASVAEDALFLRQACQRGARLLKLPHAGSFVYIRHGGNAWKFPLGSYLQPSGWRQADLSAFLPVDDLPFYTALSPIVAASRTSRSEEACPLVSCIMPTYNRRNYVPQAIRYFLRQDYANCELLILDDGSQPVDDLVPDDPRIRYVRLARRMILGAKRNLACEMAQGSLIAHWDDDDWIAPHRLSYQVELLEKQEADLCGAGQQLYYDPATNKAWLYVYPPMMRSWLAGNTLCYRKVFWTRNPFPEIAIGEDTRFVWSPKATNAIVLPDHTFYVGIIHAHNTSRKHVNGRYWHPHAVEIIQSLLDSDLAFYRSMAVATGSLTRPGSREN